MIKYLEQCSLNSIFVVMVCLNHKKNLCSVIEQGKRKAGVEKAVLSKPASSFLGIILPSTLSNYHYQPGSDETGTVSSP